MILLPQALGCWTDRLKPLSPAQPSAVSEARESLVMSHILKGQVGVILEQRKGRGGDLHVLKLLKLRLGRPVKATGQAFSPEGRLWMAT